MSECGICEGMRLCSCNQDKRFQAAVAAMQGILSDFRTGGTCEELAKSSVACADALLKELEK